MPALRKQREQRPEDEYLKEVDKQLRKLQRRKRYEEYANVPPEFAIDAAKRLPSDEERRYAAEEIRDQADSANDPDRRKRLKQAAAAIELMCGGSREEPILLRGKNIIHLESDPRTWHEARRRFDIIAAQMAAVCPDKELSEDAVWILEANRSYLKNKAPQTEEDKVLHMYLDQLYVDLYSPAEYVKYKRTGSNPWEIDGGSRVKPTGRSNDVLDYGARDYTKAGKKDRTKAFATVRHLDPTNWHPEAARQGAGDWLG
jgi:hypothetical protein